MIQKLSRPLLRWLRRLERWADRVTGAAGPVFLAVAWALLLFCVITYFDVVFPRVFMTGSWARFAFGLSLSIYMIYSFLFHYVMAISTDPGMPSKRFSRRTAGASSSHKSNTAWSRFFLVNDLAANSPLVSGAQTPNEFDPALKQKEGVDMTARSRRMLERTCKKCPRGLDGREPFKPERTHHCRVCGRCQLKYDHHCPWIHNCVGLRNERYFVLFMLYLASSATLAGFWSFRPFMEALSTKIKWSHYTPRVGIVLLFVLSVAMACALWVMAIWQLVLVVQGQTTVEANDNEYYTKVAKSKGMQFLNPYDLGRIQNLQYFFNIAPVGNHPASVLVPLPFPPASNGITWRKRPGWEANVLAFAEELTDEEDLED